ncbi:hypothetical protein QL285_046795 [Trifolium repens]|nr:hypothetical protein QL285_046795 [Trifolium repens]
MDIYSWSGMWGALYPNPNSNPQLFVTMLYKCIFVQMVVESDGDLFNFQEHEGLVLSPTQHLIIIEVLGIFGVKPKYNMLHELWIS